MLEVLCIVDLDLILEDIVLGIVGIKVLVVEALIVEDCVLAFLFSPSRPSRTRGPRLSVPRPPTSMTLCARFSTSWTSS